MSLKRKYATVYICYSKGNQTLESSLEALSFLSSSHWLDTSGTELLSQVCVAEH